MRRSHGRGGAGPPILCVAFVALVTAPGCGGTEDDAAPAGAPAAGPFTFVDATTAWGLRATHHPHRSESRHLPEIMGSGLAVADVNRDGAPDLLVVDSGPLEPLDEGGGETRVFLNDGRGRLTDGGDAWTMRHGYGMGIAVGDVDGDGWIDAFVTTYGARDRLFRNTGSGFVDVSDAWSVPRSTEWSTSAGFLDADADGDLDLYVARYIAYDLATAVKCYQNRIHIYCTPDLFDAAPDVLLRNDGGRFVSDPGALDAGEAGKGLAIWIGDVDLDGDADVYVANDQTRNNLHLGNGDGTFDDVGLVSGAGYSEEGNEQAGMGADATDVDGDGRLDLVCTNFQGETNALYLQLAPGWFREMSDALGIGVTSRTHLGFGVDFFDADNDGDEDLMVANGHIDDRVEEHTTGVGFAQRNLLFALEDGRFRDVTDTSGPALSDLKVSRGLVTADFDGDGDLDVACSNNGGPVQLLRNDTPGGGRFVGLWLEGTSTNRSAIGAVLDIQIGDDTIHRQVHGAGSYLSVPDLRVHVGLGDAPRIDRLVIHWPGGEDQTIEALDADAYYRIVEGRLSEPFTPGAGVVPPG